MPEHLRALVVILVLATVVFAVAKAPACAMASTSKDFERRRNLWFTLTLTAFLAHNFWIFIFIAAAVLLVAQRGEQNRLALFFFLLFALPRISADIPGLGIFNALFAIDYVRLLTLTVLLPAYLALRKQPGMEPFGRSIPDKLIAGYLILNLLLMFEHRTFTSMFRDGVFYAFTDAFLPYYVASRSLKNLQDFRDALMAFAVAALVLSPVLFAEFARQWMLYAALEEALGTTWGWNFYLLREGNLRASGTSGFPIAAGYTIAVAAGLYLYLRKLAPNRKVSGLALILLLAGLIAPLSRGPWLGAAAMMLVFIAIGPAPVLGFARLGLLGLIALPLLLATPAGDTIIDYLPFVGTVEASTVTGRQLLIEVSMRVFLESPVFGSPDFMLNPALQVLADANNGMIDLVNTYVVVGLSSGLVGLSLFAGFFLAVALGIYKGMRKLTDRNDEHYVLGQTLLAVLLGILVIIGTVSPVLLIPTIYWSVAGIGVAYARMLARGTVPGAAGPAQSEPATVRRGHVRVAFPPA